IRFPFPGWASGSKGFCLGRIGANGRVVKIFWNKIINIKRRLALMRQLSRAYLNYSISI
ncbi:uncharacterized protein METZ01_LOCUS233146, partial [marine metagenome]